MKKAIRIVGGCALLLFVASCEKTGGEAVFENLEQQNALLVENSYQAIPGQYVVTFHRGTLEASKAAKGATAYKEATAAGKTQILSAFSKLALSADAIGKVYIASVEGFSAKLNESQLAQLGSDPRVKSIEQDYLIILAPPPGKGPGSGGGGDGGSSAQETPYGIARVGGGGTYNGSGRAFILDTGIDLDHEDLNVDASRGFNAFTSGKDSWDLDDGNGHGTHVAGTVAAIDNNLGVVGVAPGATVIPVKVLSARGSGSYSGVISGVDFVAANREAGDAANMSLGGPVSNGLDNAVEAAAAAGVKFALAAGNESDDANNHSPARANHNNIYTVSAMDANNNFAYFSNYGNPPIDYCAPGVSILSTWKNGGYNTISGTSMAAPHVCGLLLLGPINSDGTVQGDPDGVADPIAHR